MALGRGRDPALGDELRWRVEVCRVAEDGPRVDGHARLGAVGGERGRFVQEEKEEEEEEAREGGEERGEEGGEEGSLHLLE